MSKANNSGSGQYIFLSYSRINKQFVSELAKWLEGHGVTVWYDNDIDYGLHWKKEIKRALSNASIILVVMSKAARNSKWVDRELSYADDSKIPILPMLLEPEGMVERLSKLQFDNVIGNRMPSLNFCQKLPGFLVSEYDLVKALNSKQRNIIEQITKSASGIRLGSKGPGVAGIQMELLRVGLNPGPIDGFFGEHTSIAVREFQRRRCHVEVADGMVGILTLSILINSTLGDLSSP